MLNLRPIYVNSWVGPYGEMGRDFNRHFDYRANYSLIGIVDFIGWTLDPNRVRLIPADNTDEQRKEFIAGFPGGARRASPSGTTGPSTR